MNETNVVTLRPNVIPSTYSKYKETANFKLKISFHMIPANSIYEVSFELDGMLRKTHKRQFSSVYEAKEHFDELCSLFGML